jgi:hypothetical protein
MLNFTLQQTQAVIYLRDTGLQNVQSVTAPRLPPLFNGLRNDAQHEGQAPPPRSTPDNVENALSALQLNAVANTPIIESNAQDTKDIATLNRTVSKRESLIIDIREDNIIDLTQDSDDDSVAELWPDFAFSEQKKESIALAVSNRAMEPEKRKERKKRLRKRRWNRHILEEDTGAEMKESMGQGNKEWLSTTEPKRIA